MGNIKAWIIKIHAFILIFCIQHIFDEDAVALCRIIHQNMGHRANQFSILNWSDVWEVRRIFEK